MVSPARLIILKSMSEAEWQEYVCGLADLRGWAWYHTHNSQHSNEGFPDLVLSRDERLIVSELKTETGKVTEEQRQWLRRFELAGIPAYTWRPRDIDEVEQVLR